MSRWPIRRLFLALISLTVVAFVLIAAMVIASESSQRRLRQQNAAAASVRADLFRIQYLGSQFVLYQTAVNYIPVNQDQFIGIRDDYVEQLNAAVEEALAEDIPEEQKAAVRAMDAAYSDFFTFVVSLPAVETKAEQDQQTVDYNANMKRATDAQAAANDSLQELSDSLADQTSTTANRSRTITLALLVFIALMVGVSLWLAGRRIANGILELSTSVGQLGDGDLSQELRTTGRDEIGRMADALRQLQSRLVLDFRQLHGTTQRLGTAADELGGIVSEVRQTSENSSAELDGVSTTAKEVSSSVQAVAAGGEEMGTSIGEISQSAQEAAREATTAVTAVQSTTDTMGKLSDSSRQIGDVVRLITSIAEQTNLLALNATIEAARAGDAGKGFAVVADEVKQLAQETARATEDISKRVETIQEDTHEAGEAIKSVAQVIARINEFQTTIASAVEEQTATTQAINSGMGVAAQGSTRIAEQLGAAAQMAAATAESMYRSSASAQELVAMRAELAEMISGFRLPPESSR